MQGSEFKNILKTFADRPEDVVVSRTEAALQINNSLISVSVELRESQIWVKENGKVELAEHWIADRIANLDLLARRIIEFSDPIPPFVPPSGSYIDQIEANPSDLEVETANSLQHLETITNSGAGLSSLVIYLTADAGEGKTTLINKLAVSQAEKYIAKSSRRLVLPIKLGGRPFLRLDDMIIGSIANTYRFRNLYIQNFLELVKMGFIVPAFDGFEEMFIVGNSGEAVSSLGNLLANLHSSGTLIVSARTAYFEIRDFEAQARLFDSIRNSEVSFSRLKINRWKKREFASYWSLRGLSDGEATYSSLAAKLRSESHPLLSRAVLINRLADLAENKTAFDQLTTRLGNTNSYFTELIDSIIEREITEKWLDRAENSVFRPLLSLSEHHELLGMISSEMTILVKDNLSIDELHLVTELFCEQKQLPPQISRQILNRIPDHPLLAKYSHDAKAVRFDHDEFKDYFLGESIGRSIFAKRSIEVQSIFRKSLFSNGCLDSCLDYLKSKNADLNEIAQFIKHLIELENIASAAKENGTRILLRIMQEPGIKNIHLLNSYIPHNAFEHSNITNGTFELCFFHSASLENCHLTECHFKFCEFDSIEIGREVHINGCVLEKCNIHCVNIASEEVQIFNPNSIKERLEAIGFSVQPKESTNSDQDISIDYQDEQFNLLVRSLRSFQRANGINQSILRVRLGKKSAEFESDILPELIHHQVMAFEVYKGGGSDQRIRLAVPMTEIQQALLESQGSFEAFLSYFTQSQLPQE